MAVYDVVIVGAGPAGGMAAWTAAEHGLSVLVVERRARLGVPVQCAEGITAFALRELGIDVRERWMVQEVEGVRTVLPGGSCFYSPEPGYAIDRAAFDRWLADQAVAAGARLRCKTRATALARREHGWVLQVDGESDVAGRIVIGADGPAAKVAGWTELLRSRSANKGLQYTFPAKAVPRGDSDWFSIFFDEIYQGGYAWIFPHGNEMHVGLGGPAASWRLLRRFCRSHVIDCKDKERVTAGLLPFDYRFSARAKAGVMVTGDAAGATNPVTGGGIHAALATGKLAGEVAAEAVQRANVGHVVSYDRRLRSLPFFHPVHLRAAQYLQQWTNEDWRFLGSILDGKEFSDLTLGRAALAGLRHPSYLLRSREMLTIRRSMQINQKYGW